MTPPTTERDRVVRAARQELRTSLLMGVDFIPQRDVVSPAILEVKPPEPVAAATAGAAIVTSPPVIRTPPEPATRAAGQSGISAPVRSVAPSDFSEDDAGPVAPPSVDVPDTSTMDEDERRELLEALRVRHDAECPHCTRAQGHTRTVFGEGSAAASLMFVGEAPGAEEDQTGRPFVGRAGQKLDEMIRAMKIRREDVYIANVLKARPPDNRTPQPDEVARCSPYLMAQIRIIRPKVIVTLGAPATKLILDTAEGITRIRGIWGELRLGDLTVRVMPTFHPAYLLRAYTPENRRKVWNDMQLVMEVLGL
jgi:uracil-DNA glycosylase family 4